jgi:hypothetical protein
MVEQSGGRPLPGSSWGNGYNESLNGKLRDELLNGEILYTLKEAKIMIERWGFITIPKDRIPVLGINCQHRKRFRF